MNKEIEIKEKEADREKIVGIIETLPPQTSVETKRTSKGYSWAFKIYCDDLEVVKKKQIEMRDWLNKEFPLETEV